MSNNGNAWETPRLAKLDVSMTLNGGPNLLTETQVINNDDDGQVSDTVLNEFDT